MAVAAGEGKYGSYGVAYHLVSERLLDLGPKCIPALAEAYAASSAKRDLHQIIVDFTIRWKAPQLRELVAEKLQQELDSFGRLGAQYSLGDPHKLLRALAIVPTQESFMTAWCLLPNLPENHNEGEPEKLNLADALGLFPNSTENVILAELERWKPDVDSNTYWRLELGVRLAGISRLEAAIPRLAQLGNARDRYGAPYRIQGPAVQALARIGTRIASEHLLFQLEEHPSSHTLRHAVGSLNSTEGQQLLARLQEADRRNV